MSSVKFQLCFNYGENDLDSVIVGRSVDMCGLPKIGTLFKIEPVVDYGLYGDVVLNGFKLDQLYRNVYCRVVGCHVVDGELYHNSRLSIHFLHDDYDISVNFDDEHESFEFFNDDGYVDNDGVFNCFLGDLIFKDVSNYRWEFVHAFCWLWLCFPNSNDILNEIVCEDILSSDDRKFWDVFIEWYKTIDPNC